MILPFQSTLPRRERQKQLVIHITPIQFQSTLPRRERLADQQASAAWNVCFNPRSREGSDLKGFPFQPFLKMFQSTLPRRERQQICTIFYYDIGISAQYYYIFLNKNNLMNSFKTNFNRFYYIFLVRISLHLHVKLLFAPHNTTLLT